MDFTEIYDGDELEMIQDAYDTITQLGLWDWLKNFNPHPNEGFMFSSDLTLAMLSSSLSYRGHTGVTFARTMRVVHDIARRGWEEHKTSVIAKRGAPCSCRRAKGKLTGWCGGVPGCEH